MKNSDTENKWQATLTDWCIVRHPEIYHSTENPEAVFAPLNGGHAVALFGRAKGDPRYDAETGQFADGHRLISSCIVAVEDGKYHTVDTIYTLDEETKNEKFRNWCDENQYKEEPFVALEDNEEVQDNSPLRHICESCGKEQILTPEEGFEQGWDYPPRMGAFKIVSPRTCGKCGIESTLWWEITCNNSPLDQLSERHQQTLKRILAEPESILP